MNTPDSTASTPSPAAATSPPAPPPQKPPARAARPRGRRWLRRLAWAALASLLLLTALAATAWWWSGRADSLARSLHYASTWMPEGQSLESSEVTGSLRRGGHIGQLQWRSPTMQVELSDASIAWQLRPLLQRSLRLAPLKIGQLTITSTPDPEDQSPLQPLQQLRLPVRLDIPFAVDHIIWRGPPEAQVHGLQGHYRYDGDEHRLDVDGLQWADGQYTAQLQLKDMAPMALKARVEGRLQVPVPGQPEDSPEPRTVAVHALATAQGSLAGEAARIELSAQVQAQAPNDSPQDSQASAGTTAQPTAGLPQDSYRMRADLKASIDPWQAQPLHAAQAQLEQLDIAAFWPQGPRTALSGSLHAGPADQPATLAADTPTLAGPGTAAPDPTAPASEATAWQLQARILNQLPGPWDQARLPAREIDAQVLYTGSQWQVSQAKVVVGDGHVALQGHYTPQSQQLQAQAQVHQLSPAAVHSRLDAAALQGELQAASDASGAVNFDVLLKAATAAPAIARNGTAPLRIQRLSGKGQWASPLLSLAELDIEALQAVVQARKLNIDSQALEVKGQLKAQVPGAAVQLDGAISAQAGQGKLAAQLLSAPALRQWLARLPGITDPLAKARLEGLAQLELQWRGGWGGLQKRLEATAGESWPASGLQLQASMQAQRLLYQASPTDTALELPELQLQLSGSPERADLQLKGQARQGAQNLRIDTRLQAGLASARGAAPLDWQASIQALQAQIQIAAKPATPGSLPAPANTAGTWNIQLQSDKPLELAQRSTGKLTRMSASAASLQVTPPTPQRANAAAPAPALLAWENTVLTQSGKGPWALVSKGRAQGLPLAWVDALAPGEGEPPLAAMGLSGDLSINGQWDVDTTGGNLRAKLLVERAGGDLRLAVEDGNGTTVVQTSGPSARQPGEKRTRTVRGAGMRARIQQMRLEVEAKGNDVQANLLWDSERAGHIKASLNTRLTPQDGLWAWGERAPLSGQIEASMPDIGIWALFAPPGWRVTGDLKAKAQISGDRQKPQWQGNLSADGLSIVSVLDGVDLHDGVLRARLQGTRLDITELRLHGGKGSAARILGYSGNLTTAPQDGGELTGTGFVLWEPAGADGQSSGLRMDLQAQARKLQVLVRADRQVSVSGSLQARLDQGQFVLRGDLVADRATIILPEESAPSLDSDVIVRSAASRQAAREAAEKEQRAAATAQARAVPRKLPDIAVQLDLGPDFALQGYGITTRLTGQLQVLGATVASGPPRITGEVRTQQGRYRAWGQSLDVEEGLIRFNGPYNNPSLDILAIRPNIAVRAGVQVLGTATAPRVRLYSDPDLPDAEKLSWVVMGRDPAAGGAEGALLQQAALALLSGGGGGSGNIAGSVGLDEIGFKGPGDGNDASAAALTLGKRLSKDLYVTYEQSLSGAMGTLYIFYDLSRRLTLRGQTGETSALDLIYTMRKD